MGVGNVPSFPSLGVGMRLKNGQLTGSDGEDNSNSEEWFSDAVSVVGEVIGFWGFKENHGRIWAFLYLSIHPVSTSDIRKTLQLSKGATSMLLNELEEWRVILQNEHTTGRERTYVANPNFVEMIVRVMERRESDMLDQVVARLNDVQQTASQSNATTEQIESIQKMVDLAKMVRQIVSIGQKLQSRNIKKISILLKTIDAML